MKRARKIVRKGKGDAHIMNTVRSFEHETEALRDTKVGTEEMRELL